MENLKNETSPKHFFLHIFAIIMLYFLTINFITLVFQYINILISDPAFRDASQGAARFALASIIVVSPAFFFSSWLLQKNYKENPAVKQMKIRKWLVYLTIFIGVLVVISNFITIIFWFLKGEITLRFILKALSLLIIIGAISAYYIRDIKKDITFSEKRYWAIAGALAVFAAIVIGFFIAGSPQKERLRQLDRQKIEDLNNIQGQITFYWQKNGHLPESLSEIRVPQDPQGKPYEYIVKGDESFQLCAEFNLPFDEETPYRTPYNWTWQHGAGRECIDRTVNKEPQKLIE